MTLDSRKYKMLGFTYQSILSVYILIHKALNYTEKKDIANYDPDNTSVSHLRNRIIKKKKKPKDYSALPIH